MKIPVLAGFLAIATCTGAAVWSPGRSYSYHFDGWLYSGIPDLKQQYSGIYLSGDLVLEPAFDKTITFALRNTIARKFNQPLEKPIASDPELWKSLGEIVDILDSSALQRPATVSFSGDDVKSITVAQGEPLWSVNMKKAIAAKLQLHLSEGKGPKEVLARLQSNEKNHFSTVENSVSGDCEVLYQLVMISEDSIKADLNLLPFPGACGGSYHEIVKTVNLKSCTKPSVLYHVSPFAAKCDHANNDCGRSRTRSVTSRTVGCGTTDGDFIVQQQVTTDTLLVKPFGSETEPIEATNFISLRLQSVESGTTLTPATGKVVKGLTYAHSDKDLSGGSIPQPGLKDPIIRPRPSYKVLEKEIRRLMSEVVPALSSQQFLLAPEDTGVSSKIDAMRMAASLLPYAELKSTFNKELGLDQQSTESQVALSVLTAAGTNPAILLLKDLVLKGKLTGELACQAFSFLPVTIKTPTVGILKELYELLKSDLAKNEPVFESTIALALSSIVRQACVSKSLDSLLYPTELLGELCTAGDSLIEDEIIPKFAKIINDDTSNYRKLSFIVALGNLEHKSTLPILTSIIRAKKAKDSDLLRLRAVASLKRLVEAKNQQATDLLSAVFFDVNEEPELRTTALNVLLFADAPLALWQTVAARSWFEPSYLVQHFIAHSMKNIATFEKPEQNSIMTKAKAVLPLVKPTDWSFPLSRNYVGSYYDGREDAGYLFQFAANFGKESGIPLEAFLNIDQKQGQLDFNLFRFGIIGKLVPNLNAPFYGSPRTSPGVKAVRDLLKIQPYDEVDERYFHFNAMDGLERIWPLNAEAVQSLAETVIRGPVRYQKWDTLGDSLASIPMELGIPVLVDSRWKIINSLLLDTLEPGQGLGIEVSATSGFKILSTASFDVPFVNTVVSSGVDMDSYITLVPSRFTFKEEDTRLFSRWEPVNGKTSFFYYHVKPFTATKDSADQTPIDLVPDAKLVTVHEKPIEVNVPLRDQLLGVDSKKIGLEVYLAHKADSKTLKYLSTLAFWANTYRQGKLINRVLMAVPSDSRYRQIKWTLDVPASETKAIEVNLNAAFKYRNKLRHIFGKANLVNTDGLDSLFGPPVTNGKALVASGLVKLIGSTTQKIETSVTLGYGTSGTTDQAAIHITKKFSSGKEVKTCIDGEITWPQATSLKRSVGQDLAVDFSASFARGANCRRPDVVIEGRMSQNEDQLQFARSSQEARACAKEEEKGLLSASAECIEARKQATDFNRYEIEVAHPWSPSGHAQNLTHKFETFIKSIGFDYVQKIANVQNPSNTIKAVLELNPRQKPLANAEFSNSGTTVYFKDAPLDPFNHMLLPINAHFPIMETALNTVGVCAIEGTHVHTLNGDNFEAGFSSSEYVIATDCTGYYDFAILVRLQGAQKVVTVIYKGEKVILDPVAGRVDVSCGSGRIRVEQSDGFLKAEVPYFGTVAVSGDKVILTARYNFRGDICGLCSGVSAAGYELPIAA